MTPHPYPIGDIVVGVDGSLASDHAVLWASAEARLHHRGLTLVHAQRPLGSQELAWFATAGIPPTEINEQIRRDAHDVLARARTLAAERLGETGVETLLHSGDPRSVLMDLADGAPMVVVGSRGHGRVVGMLLGSVSGALVRHATCPVAVVRTAGDGRHGVLVGADGTEASAQTLEVAFAEASARGLPLTVVHCLWDVFVGQPRWGHVGEANPEGHETRLRMAESLAGMTDKYPDVPVHVSITRGAVDACLVDLSHHHDLLVIGRPPRSLGERLVFPGMTLSIAEQAHAPVLVVP